MRRDNSALLEELAASIADGRPVDWDQGESRLTDGERRLLRHLHLIDTLAEVYRSMPAASDDGSEPDVFSDPQPAGPKWGRLILLDRIGQGTSGDVFRAWDVDLQREVALKLLRVDGVTGDAAANARMLQEARRIARVRHPHVVQVYGAERHEERVGVWMELVRGQSLDEIVRAEGPMTADAASRIGADLCGAVGAVHAANLLHRDIKAQNVIRDDTGRIVLMDFGAGEEIGAVKARVAGTPLYIAPEVLTGGSASVASDVYSLGVLLFYLVTRAFPVQAASLEALTDAHRSGARKPLRQTHPEVPAAFARIVDRALADDPSARYQTSAAMEKALRDFTAAPSESLVRRPRVWVAAAAMAATVVALLAPLASSRTAPPRAAQDPTLVAVLPLTFVSGQGEAPYLADALTDELITTLGQVKALRVTSHTSVRRFRGTNESIQAIAAQLGVGSVLEGSIAVQPSVATPAAQQVRVNLRLIRAGTDLEMWSESFERPLADVLAMERDIARAVAHSVRATVTAEESARLERQAPASAPAQRAYLEGVSYLAQNRHGAEVRPALDALQRSIALDPSFAAPNAAAARAYVLLGFDGEIPQREAYAAAKAAAQQALALDPNLADAHVALGDVSFYYEWDWAVAEAEYVRAISLDGSDVYARRQYAHMLAAAGRTDEARRQADQAVSIDPLTPDVTLTAGLMAYYQRRYDEAREILHRVTLMDPRFAGAYRTLARIEEARGNITDAIDLTDRSLRLTDTPAWRSQGIRLRALAGHPALARRSLAQLYSRLAVEGRTLDGPHEAYVRLALGERDAAIDLLSAAVDARDPAVLWMAVDPRLDPIRTDPRFQSLVARLGHP